MNRIISTAQHGFVKKRSTTTNQLEMLDILNLTHDNKMQTDMIFIDFSKAFDLVTHSKLIQVMICCNINKAVIKWMAMLLQSRTQQTVVEGQTSRSTKVTSGVPQGSVIGPQTFNIYINWLLLSIQSIPEVHVMAFADDVTILSSNHVALQNALLCLELWCGKYGLKINPAKSEHMCFRKTMEHTFTIAGETINKVTSTKHLGIVINDNLKWQQHCSKITTKATTLSYIILRSFQSKHKFVSVKAYKSYVRPLLETNSVVWNATTLGDIRCIEAVQRTFTRKLLQKSNVKYKDYKDRLEILRLESLELRRLQIDIVTVFKIIYKYIDLTFENFYTPKDYL